MDPCYHSWPTLHSDSACLRLVSLSCVCSPLFWAVMYCSFSCSPAHACSVRVSRLLWIWSWEEGDGGERLGGSWVLGYLLPSTSYYAPCICTL